MTTYMEDFEQETTLCWMAQKSAFETLYNAEKTFANKTLVRYLRKCELSKQTLSDGLFPS
jgi:hypothetical protein